MRLLTTQLLGQLAQRINEVGSHIFEQNLNDQKLSNQDLVNSLEDLEDAAKQLKICLISEYDLKEPHFYDDDSARLNDHVEKTGN